MLDFKKRGDIRDAYGLACEKLVETYFPWLLDVLDADVVAAGEIKTRGIAICGYAYRAGKGTHCVMKNNDMCWLKGSQNALKHVLSGKCLKTGRDTIYFRGTEKHKFPETSAGYVMGETLGTLTVSIGKRMGCREMGIFVFWKEKPPHVDEKFQICLALMKEMLAMTETRDAKAPQHLSSVVFGAVTELVAIQDAKHRILYANSTAGESVNKEPHELLGHYCYEIWHGRNAPCPYCPVVIAKQTKKFADNVIKGADGRMWYIRAFPVLSESGELIAVVEITGEITAEMQLREKLAEREEEYWRFIDNAVAGVYRSRLNDGLVVMANDAFAKILGYRNKEEIVGKFVASEHYVSPEERPEIVKMAKAGKLPASSDVALRGADGKVHILNLHSRVVKIGGEEFFEGVAIDVTKERELEMRIEFISKMNALRADIYLAVASSIDTSALFSACCASFVRNLYALACIYTKHGNTLEMQAVLPAEHKIKKICRALSEAQESLVCSVMKHGRTEVVIVSDDYPDKNIADIATSKNIHALIALPVIDRGSIRGVLLLGKAGKTDEFSLEEIRTLEEIAGNIGFGYGTITDRLEKIKLSEKLAKEEKMLEVILNNVSDVLCMVNTNGEIEFITPSVKNLTGYSPDEATGKNLLEVIERQDRDIVSREAEMALLLNIPVALELQLRTKSGESKICDVSIVPIKDETGADKLVISARDITDRKRAQELAIESERYKVQALVASVFPSFIPGSSDEVLGIMMEGFANRFEKFHRDDFMKYMCGAEEKGMDKKDAYLEWLKEFFRTLGANIKHHTSGGHLFVEILNCPWEKDARANPIMCGLCKAIVFRSATWVGDIKLATQHTSIAGGDRKCKFELNIEDARKNDTNSS